MHIIPVCLVIEPQIFERSLGTLVFRCYSARLFHFRHITLDVERFYRENIYLLRVLHLDRLGEEVIVGLGSRVYGDERQRVLACN